MKVLYFAFCFAIAAFAGWVTNLSYQASIIEMNESIAHSEIGMVRLPGTHESYMACDAHTRVTKANAINPVLNECAGQQKSLGDFIPETLLYI